MKYKPHSYQEYAIRYIETHPISTLLIDMGLGKTSITLTAIRNLQGACNRTAQGCKKHMD